MKFISTKQKNKYLMLESVFNFKKNIISFAFSQIIQELRGTEQNLLDKIQKPILHVY